MHNIKSITLCAVSIIFSAMVHCMPTDTADLGLPHVSIPIKFHIIGDIAVKTGAPVTMPASVSLKNMMKRLVNNLNDRFNGTGFSFHRQRTLVHLDNRYANFDWHYLNETAVHEVEALNGNKIDDMKRTELNIYIVSKDIARRFKGFALVPNSPIQTSATSSYAMDICDPSFPFPLYDAVTLLTDIVDQPGLVTDRKGPHTSVTSTVGMWLGLFAARGDSTDIIYGLPDDTTNVQPTDDFDKCRPQSIYMTPALDSCKSSFTRSQILQMHFSYYYFRKNYDAQKTCASKFETLPEMDAIAYLKSQVKANL